MRYVYFSLVVAVVLLLVWGYRFLGRKLQEHDKLQAALLRGERPFAGGFVIMIDPTKRASK